MSDQPMTVTDEDREAAAKAHLYRDYAQARWLNRGLPIVDMFAEAFAAHRIAAAKAERDAVVKWLREVETGRGGTYRAASVAQAIEAREHLTPPTA